MTETVTPNLEPTSAIIRLSAFLSGCQSNELLHILDDYNQGLLTVLEALPLQGEAFTVSVTGLNGKVSERTVSEELIRDTPEAQAWRDERAESSRLAIVANTGEVGITLETVTDNPDEFAKLLASRRVFLKNTKGRAKPASAQAKKPVKTATPPSGATKSTSKPKSKNSGSETPPRVTEEPAPTKASEE